MRLLATFVVVILAGVGTLLMGGATTATRPLDPAAIKRWHVSDWPAGQTKIATWSSENVRPSKDGAGMDFVLDHSGDPDAERPYRGAEIQSRAKSSTGRWAWLVEAPQMTDGAVFGLFLYRADHDKDPWREYDFEFVGADTTKVQLNIHFEPERGGKRVTLDQARGGPVIVDLGFDASEDAHLYEIEVHPGRAVFRVDGDVVGDFTRDDMPDGVWNDGPLRSFINLWPVSKAQEDWAGKWTRPERPLVARVLGTLVPDPR